MHMTWTGDAEEWKESTIRALMADQSLASEDLTSKHLRYPYIGSASVALALEHSTVPATAIEISRNVSY